MSDWQPFMTKKYLPLIFSIDQFPFSLLVLDFNQPGISHLLSALKLNVFNSKRSSPYSYFLPLYSTLFTTHSSFMKFSIPVVEQLLNERIINKMVRTLILLNCFFAFFISVLLMNCIFLYSMFYLLCSMLHSPCSSLISPPRRSSSQSIHFPYHIWNISKYHNFTSNSFLPPKKSAFNFETNSQLNSPCSRMFFSEMCSSTNSRKSFCNQ